MTWQERQEMKRRTLACLVFLTIGVIVLSLLFLAADWLSGTSVSLNSQVIGRHYTPPKEDVTVGTDINGDPKVDIDSTEEAFHVICKSFDPVRVFDITTTRAQYYDVEVSQEVVIKVTKGRLTGKYWWPRLDN